MQNRVVRTIGQEFLGNVAQAARKSGELFQDPVWPGHVKIAAPWKKSNGILHLE